MTARKSLNLEKSLAGLESLVEELEGGELPLDKAMKKFEEGVKLTRECQAALKKIMGKALDNADEDPMDQLRGHSMHIIACLEDPAVIRKILNHLQEKSPRDSRDTDPHSRAPPQASLFG